MKIVVLGDMHVPYQMNGMAGLFRRIKREIKPDKIYQIGDLVDMYAFGKYVRDPEAMSAGAELKEAIAELNALAKEIKDMEIIQGNHEVRLIKRAMEAGIPKSLIRDFADFLELPEGWKYRSGPLIIPLTKKGDQKAVLIHGESAGGQQALFQLIRQYRMNIIAGHLHSMAGVMYLNNGLQTNWAMLTGCLVDRESMAFAYGHNSKDKEILSFGMIEDGVPRIIPV
jgi:predicted phosphodiesterase